MPAAGKKTTVARRPVSELNHVGADTWLVPLVDRMRDAAAVLLAPTTRTRSYPLGGW